MLRAIILAAISLLAPACQLSSTRTAQLAEAHTHATYHLDSGIYNTAALANPNRASAAYISVAVPFAAIQSLKTQLIGATRLTLKDRGQAHITVLSPPELGTIRKRLSEVAILKAMDNDSLQEETFEALCVGAGQKPQGGMTRQVFFLVIKADGLVARRQKLAEAFRLAGGANAAFDPEHFYPHITVGFTHTDLFEQDGVIKDEHSCVAAVVVEP